MYHKESQLVLFWWIYPGIGYEEQKWKRGYFKNNTFVKQ
jgi:hypothetical protein